jgi:hypothetical protein
VVEGHSIGSVQGTSTPFAIRKREEGGYFLVRECYINGLMYREGMEIGKEEEITLF